MKDFIKKNETNRKFDRQRWGVLLLTIINQRHVRAQSLASNGEPAVSCGFLHIY